MKKVILFCISILLAFSISAQKKAKFELCVTGTDFHYVINDNSFEAYVDEMKFDSIKGKNVQERKCVDKNKITKEYLLKIKQICREFPSIKNQFESTRIMSSEMNLVIQYKIDGDYRTIILKDYPIKETNELFSILNKYIKDKKYQLPLK